MRQNRNETDAFNESESPSVQRGLLYARLSSVSPGRESTDDALSSSNLQEWSDVHEIYRLRRNLLNLFVHNTNQLS